ncbi:MAG: hypothetical protein N2Z65_07950 [Clostridiales bacterium]|nr:hypothetical protein [Clostridiales bacterium]
MENLLKFILIAVVAAFLALLIKKDNPQIAVMVSLSAIILILIALTSELRSAMSLIKKLGEYTSLPEETIVPLLKIVGVSIVTSISVHLCKDVNEGALAYASELVGVVAAMIIAIPLFNQVFSMILSLV